MGQAAQLAEVADTLRTTAGVYTSTDSDLDSTTFILTGVVQELLAGWQGASSQAFVNACNKAWNDEGKISGSLSSTASALTALAGALENNITSISAYETDSASTTIQPAALQAAEQAANLAWAAIASAVAEQAAAIEAAAAQVGVCSIGEGGPWSEGGWNAGTSQDPPKKTFLPGDSASSWRDAIRTKVLIGILVAIANFIYPTLNNHGRILPIPFGLGAGTSIIASFVLGSYGFPENAILQTFFGQSLTILGYEFIPGAKGSPSYPTGVSSESKQTLSNGETVTFTQYNSEDPEGRLSDTEGTLKNGEVRDVTVYTDGTTVREDTTEQDGVIETTKTTTSSDGKVTTSTTFKLAPVPAPPKTSPTPTTQPTRWGVESRL